MSLLQRLTNRLKSFSAHQSGVVAVIFGIAVIPVAGIVGASLDYSRASNVQTQLQDALDAAILTVAHQQNMTDAALEAAVRTQIGVLVDNAHGADTLILNIARNTSNNLLEISATMKVDTTLLELMGVKDITVGAESAVNSGFGDMEVALVLDNTGSMRHSDRIGSLRTAALDFVRIVSDSGQSQNLMISLVPYTAQVNIGNTRTMEQYLDKQGLSEHHAALIEDQYVARNDRRSCRNASMSDAGDITTPATEFATADGISAPGFARLSFLDVYADVLQELIGINEANASTIPYELVADGCFLRSPTQISHWQLYEQLNGISWKGCVEARPEPLDTTDTPPDPSNPDTLWVPGFWVDDGDDNNWLPNREPDDHDFVRDGDVYNVAKYQRSSGHSVDETPNSTHGPAQNCGDPIVPLTSNFNLLEERIRSMTYWLGGGTVTAQGVVWGWRTLSPAFPFAEGQPYDDVTKVMLVMTDGNNELVESSDSAIGSHYSAYGHLNSGRLPPASVDAARRYIDERTLAACSNAKAAGIVVYTVTFGLDALGRTMWDQCATETANAYHVDSPAELISAFNTIAGSVAELRLTR